MKLLTHQDVMDHVTENYTGLTITYNTTSELVLDFTDTDKSLYEAHYHIVDTEYPAMIKPLIIKATEYFYNKGIKHLDMKIKKYNDEWTKEYYRGIK